MIEELGKWFEHTLWVAILFAMVIAGVLEYMGYVK